jgi:hypothetical protein
MFGTLIRPRLTLRAVGARAGGTLAMAAAVPALRSHGRSLGTDRRSRRRPAVDTGRGSDSI